MNKYHIRYNTKHGESDLVWRIIENGKEIQEISATKIRQGMKNEI